MNKTHQAAKCDWQVITSRAKSCSCVNPMLFWQVHLFPTVSHWDCSACLMDNKTLAMLHVLALKHQLYFNIFFSHENICLFSNVTPCEATAPFSASTSVKNNVCWPACWWETVHNNTEQCTHIIEMWGHLQYSKILTWYFHIFMWKLIL